MTGLNAAFYIDRQTRDELVRVDRKNVEVLKPFAGHTQAADALGAGMDPRFTDNCAF